MHCRVLQLKILPYMLEKIASANFSSAVDFKMKTKLIAINYMWYQRLDLWMYFQCNFKFPQN